MIYEAPEILAISEQKERMDNALRAISALIPEQYWDYRMYGNEFSDTMTMIMYHVFVARGLKPTPDMEELIQSRRD